MPQKIFRSPVPFRPTGRRVLIEPHAPPRQTPSGLELVRDWAPETVGTVVEMGSTAHHLAPELHELARKLRTKAVSDAHDDDVLIDAADWLRALSRQDPGFRPGDRVVFSWQSGQELRLQDRRYLIMPYDDVLAVLEETPHDRPPRERISEETFKYHAYGMRVDGTIGPETPDNPMA